MSSASMHTHRTARSRDRAPGKLPHLQNPQDPSLLLRIRPESRFRGCREFRPMFLDPRPRPPLNLHGQGRIHRLQGIHPVAKPQCIERADCKCSIAALRAPQPAQQPLARPARSVRKSCVDNLHQFGIPGRKSHAAKHNPKHRRGLPGSGRAAFLAHPIVL